MELQSAIDERRSIRKFTDAPVSKEVLIEAIKNGIKAPSAHNRQPWKFKIVTKEEKNKIAELLYDSTKDIPGHTGPHTANIIKEVPELIVIFIDNQNHKERDMDIISIGACIENVILSLVEKGLGTIWIGNTNIISKEISKFLNTPYETVSCLGVGAQAQFPHARPRKNLEDVLL